MPLLIYVLTVAIFAQGTSEFMLAGLLTDIAHDFSVSAETVGTLTSAFAAGMVVGAPTMAVLVARLPARISLIGFLLVFLAAHVLGALTESFPTLLVTRVVAAFAYAGFLAVALSATRSLVPEDRINRAIAVLLAGTTLATIVGVPAGAALAQLGGWRGTFWAVCVLTLPALVILFFNRSPMTRGNGPRSGIRSELNELRRWPVIGSVLLAALFNAGTFGVFTFLGLLGVDAGIPDALIPLLLAAFGIGSFLGVAATGRWAAGREKRWIGMDGALASVGWALMALCAGFAPMLFVLSFLVGALSFAVGSALISRIVREAHGAPLLGGSYATAALNVGAFLGPIGAGAAYAMSGGAGVAWVAAATAACGTALVPLLWIGRRRPVRHA
ncbi:MFS transporter [Microbacterium murale]|uniref:DHA1 family chloramphenicol resistance protein-like MFS transporter n=1 Tax=Microbacterium murale TaxID=1081040 RepID=A0ABU0PAK9_9MICO|nr:MFS transporter [Microbacterium murale]MDQ0644375.1 DHA1 family chloramphenicol resistance protein-like MFS transporter [Microbacterium murale]